MRGNVRLLAIMLFLASIWGLIDMPFAWFTLGLSIVMFVASFLIREHRDPPTITYVPMATKMPQSGSKWLPGIFVRVPGIPWLSVGLWRWRGRR
jgi:hypothetical protein